jgi:threonine dehydratase
VVAPDIKVQAVKRLGGIVELVGETYTETQSYAQVCPSTRLSLTPHHHFAPTRWWWWWDAAYIS